MFGRMLPSSGQYVEQQGTGGYIFKPRGMKLIIYLKAQCYFFPVLCVYVVSLISFYSNDKTSNTTQQRFWLKKEGKSIELKH